MPRPSAINDIWPQDKIDALKAHWQSGMPASKIAEHMGITKNSVLSKVHKLDLPKRMAVGAAAQRKPHGNKGQPKAAAIVARIAATRSKVANPLGAHIKRRAAPKPAAEPLDMEDGPYTDVTHLLGIMDLERGDCRWPVTGEGSATLFCGVKVKHGPYCPEHSERAGAGYGKGARP